MKCVKGIYHMLWHHRQWQPNSPRRSSFSHSVCSHCLCSQLSCSPSLSAPAPSQKLGPHTNSTLQQCSLASCCECPGRCYTELPPSLAGRLHTHCNQAGHICVCVRARVLQDRLSGCLSSLQQLLFNHLISATSQWFPHCNVSASTLSQTSLQMPKKEGGGLKELII